ncbi:MAG: alpha/beta hydrolase, partial [Cyanobacteria bacterium J06631_9]
MNVSQSSGIFCAVRQFLANGARLNGARLRGSISKGAIGASLAAGLGAAMAVPGVAAERVVIRVGPLSQSIELSDLQTFADTGEVPPSLQLYEQFLSPSVRQGLSQELELDPQMSDRIIEDVLSSANGELLVSTLSQVAPNLTVNQLQAAIRLAAMQSNGLSVLGILRAV